MMSKLLLIIKIARRSIWSNKRRTLISLFSIVIATGIPIEIKRNGHIVKIILDDKKKTKLGNLVKHDCIVGDPEELVDLSLHEWDEETEL
mgnify:CR=1 FL=1